MQETNAIRAVARNGFPFRAATLHRIRLGYSVAVPQQQQVVEHVAPEHLPWSETGNKIRKEEPHKKYSYVDVDS